MRLKDRVAIITGAGSGIGAGVGRRFAREGARVVCADIDAGSAERTVSELTADGHAAVSVSVDVAEQIQAERMVATAVEAFGQVDIVVNCAGVGLNAAFFETTPDQFRRIMQVNVEGTLNAAQAAAREMVKRDYGRIINIASIAGQRAAFGRTAYGTSKAAVIGLTRQMALELGPLGITANAIGPGPVSTPLLEAALSPEGRQAFIDLIPAGRFAEIAEIADAATFLAGEPAAFVNGQVLFVDGGYTAIGSRHS